MSSVTRDPSGALRVRIVQRAGDSAGLFAPAEEGFRPRRFLWQFEVRAGATVAPESAHQPAEGFSLASAGEKRCCYPNSKKADQQHDDGQGRNISLQACLHGR